MGFKTEVSKIETKTVREVAEIIGVSKQAIFKKINQLPPELTPTKVNGVYQLSPRIVDFIVNSTKTGNDKIDEVTTDNQPVDDQLATLNAIINELKSDKSYLNEQIYIKDKQLERKNTPPTGNLHVDSEVATLKELIRELKGDKTLLNEQLREKDKEINNQSIDDMSETMKLLFEQKDNEIKRIEMELTDKNKQIEKLHSLIDQQQQLALQTQLQNNKLQLQLEEIKEKSDFDIKDKKKWWHFFK